MQVPQQAYVEMMVKCWLTLLYLLVRLELAENRKKNNVRVSTVVLSQEQYLDMTLRTRICYE